MSEPTLLPSAKPSRSVLRRLGAALLTPVLLGLSAPGGLAIWLLPFALIPWAVIARRGGRFAFLIDYVVGMATQIFWVRWIASVTGVGVFITVTVEGLLFPLVGVCLRKPLRTWPLVFALPFAWIGWEYLRGVWPLDGFPWLLLGHAAADWDWMLALGAVFGVTGATLLCTASAGALADLVLAREERSARVRAVCCLLLWLAAFFTGSAWRTAEEGRDRSGELASSPAVVVIQPGVAQAVKFEHSALQVFAHNMSLTSQALVSAEALLESQLSLGLLGSPWVPAVPPPFVPPQLGQVADDSAPQHFGPDLVAWAETMLLWVRPATPELAHYRRGKFAAELEEQDRRIDQVFRASWLCGGELAARGASFFVGQVVATPGADGDIEERNAAVLFDRSFAYAASGRYDKRKLVPGGEYIPFIDAVPFGEKISAAILEAAGYLPDLRPGHHSAALRLSNRSGGAPWRVGSAVCLDNVYEDVFREASDLGADWHLVLSNEGWFKGSDEQDHMLAFSAWRAAENERAVLRSTNTGVSALFDPRGRMIRVLKDRAGKDRDIAGWMWARVPIAEDRSMYRAGGWWLAPLVASAGALLLFGHAVLFVLAVIARRNATHSERTSEEKTETEQGL